MNACPYDALYINPETNTAHKCNMCNHRVEVGLEPSCQIVCPTEIRGFQAMLGDFQAEGVEVIGASTDSFFSHKAWFEDRKIFADDITHPVIADTNHTVSRAFDVLKEDQGVAYRATAIVDDQGVIRSLSVNDLSAGRSPAEALRTVQALRSGGLCAADWKKGDAFVG